MKSFGKVVGSMLLLGAVLVAALVAAGLLWGAPFGHAMINIDGETLDLAQWQGGDALACLGGLAIGALVLLVVVPFAVFLPLMIVGVVLALVLAIVLAVLGATLAGVAALVFSPLFLVAAVVWLIWRLVRRSDKPVATISP